MTSTMLPPSPVVLSGDHVRLEPAAAHHAEALWATVTADTFRFMPALAASVEGMADAIARAAARAERGEALALVQVALPSGEVAGHTGLWNVDCRHRRLEIGATWLAPRFRRSAINTEAKLLLLRHAFEELGANRVEFKTDARNARSRAALLRIGAAEEGALRAHMLLDDGSWRDSVYYSVLADEWRGVEARLRGLLDAHAG